MSVPATKSDGELLDALRQFPTELRRAVQGASADALRRPASDGGWGAIEHLAHIRDWEEVFLGRIVAVLDRDRERPDLPAYDDALWSIEREYSSRQAERMLAEFATLRGEILDAIDRAEDGCWEREGVHGVYGPVSLRWLLGRLHDHGVEHIRQIRELLA